MKRAGSRCFSPETVAGTLVSPEAAPRIRLRRDLNGGIDYDPQPAGHFAVHILFVHQNYPAQFGHIAADLTVRHGCRCTFVSERPGGFDNGIERIQYTRRGGARATNHYCSRTFENVIWHSHGMFEALQARPDVRPDLVVAHSGFSTSVFLRELYDCPIVNFFEYFYSPTNSDMDFRPDFPCEELARLRARTRNAAMLLDLENCDAGYSPTVWQRERFPRVFHHKLSAIFDGVDTTVWHRKPTPARTVAGQTLPEDMKIVTYVARGFEAMRGFDIFMQTARRLCEIRTDMLFVVVGEDRCCYGNDQRITGDPSFKNWVLAQDDYDLSRFLFTGRVPPHELANLLSLSDLHIYLTVPFVLSWSLMNAFACGATVLGSKTGPVEEMIVHEQNGLLADFFDLDEWVAAADRVLSDPAAYRPLGAAAAEMIGEHYSLEVCLPRMLQLYEDVINRSAPQPTGEPEA